MVKSKARASPWRDRVLRLERVRASDLAGNPQNWRRHPPAQVEALKGVLSEVGFAGALLAYQDGGKLTLIDGHLRAGLDPEAEVPVLVLDVDRAEARKLLATYDPLGAMAAPDQDALLALLQSVDSQSQAVKDMLEALANGSYAPLMPMPNMEPKGLTDPDDVPEVPAESWVKRGDIFQLGQHRVMCGDSTNAEDVEGLMCGERASMLWTDPPYGVSYVGKTSDALQITNDDMKGLQNLLEACFKLCGELCVPGTPFYIARPAGALCFIFNDAVRVMGWHLHEELQWIKSSMVLGHSDYHLRHETIMYGWLPGPGRSGRGRHEGSRWFGGNSETSVFEIPGPRASTEHPTCKPVALVERQVGNSSRLGDTVYDPFLGSGTTLIACEKLGRICYGMEIEPSYVQVALERWQNYTGRKAVKIDGNGHQG